MYDTHTSTVGNQLPGEASVDPSRAVVESAVPASTAIAGDVGVAGIPTTSAELARRRTLTTWSCAGFLAGLLVWSFWYTVVDLWRVWQNNADYSAGQLVPLAAVYMVFVRRRTFRGCAYSFSLVGFGIFAFGLAGNLLGNYYLYASLQNLGLVVCLNGLAMTFLGWRAYKQVWYPLLFLLLMVPLPNRIHEAVMLPLQGFSAIVSAGVLEILGLPVTRFGHVSDIGGAQIAVAETCNGLRMAFAFLIVAGVIVYLVRLQRWQKALVLLSSVPIAIVCNVLRIVGTACLYGTRYEWMARGSAHEMSGLLMMPVAVALIILELRLLSGLAGRRRIGSADKGLEGVPSSGVAT